MLYGKLEGAHIQWWPPGHSVHRDGEMFFRPIDYEPKLPHRFAPHGHTSLRPCNTLRRQNLSMVDEHYI
jgi:hypothetical protein